MGRLLARLGVALGVALVVLVGVLLAVLPSQGEERAHSVFSTGADGLRALYLTLEELGLPVQPWSETPRHLVGPGTLLVLAGLPASSSVLPARLAEGPGEQRRSRGRDLDHYRRFVVEGGTLLVLDAREDALESLRETLALPGLAGVGCDDLAPQKPMLQLGLEGLVESTVLVTFTDGESLALPAGPGARFRGVAEHEILARSERGDALFVQRSSGAGRIALLALPVGLFENATLTERAEPALLFVRALETLRPSGTAPFERLLFDEYAIGGWRPASVGQLAFSPRLAWLSLHVLLLALVVGWRSAWSGPFPRDPEAWLAASPLARARGFGNLLARAQRWDLLARLLRQNVLQRLEARAGRHSPSGEAPELAARLTALARGDERRRARLAELFSRGAPRDETELNALEAGLRALEREHLTLAPEKTRRTLGGRPSRTGS